MKNKAAQELDKDSMHGKCIMSMNYCTHCKSVMARSMGKLGGQVKSEAKTKAVRENGKKGGRPKKPVENAE